MWALNWLFLLLSTVSMWKEVFCEESINCTVIKKEKKDRNMWKKPIHSNMGTNKKMPYVIITCCKSSIKWNEQKVSHQCLVPVLDGSLSASRHIQLSAVHAFLLLSHRYKSSCFLVSWLFSWKHVFRLSHLFCAFQLTEFQSACWISSHI